MRRLLPHRRRRCGPPRRGLSAGTIGRPRPLRRPARRGDLGRRPERARTAIRVHRRWRRSQPLLRRLERAARRGTGHRALHGGRPHQSVVLVLRQLHLSTTAPADNRRRRSAPRAAGPRTSRRPEDAIRAPTAFRRYHPLTITGWPSPGGALCRVLGEPLVPSSLSWRCR